MSNSSKIQTKNYLVFDGTLKLSQYDDFSVLLLANSVFDHLGEFNSRSLHLRVLFDVVKQRI